MGWTALSISCIGSGHAASGAPLQDASAAEVVSDTLLAVVADGCGSALRADEAATLSVRLTMDALKCGAATISDADSWQRFVQEHLTSLRRELQSIAHRSNSRLEDFATTLIFLVAGLDHLACAQIGDGATLYGTPEAEALSILTHPDRGEYANESSFVTSADYLDHLQCRFVSTAANRIMAFSDGVQALALDMQRGTPEPHSPFCQPLFAFAGEVSDPSEGRQALSEFLLSPRVLQRTDDDKTLVIAVRSGSPTHAQCPSDSPASHPEQHEIL
jgi:hypothetical protein